MKVKEVKNQVLVILSAILFSVSCGRSDEVRTENEEKIVSEAIQQIELAESKYRSQVEALGGTAATSNQSVSNDSAATSSTLPPIAPVNPCDRPSIKCTTELPPKDPCINVANGPNIDCTPPLPPKDPCINVGNEFKQGCITPLPPCDYIKLGNEFKEGCITPLPPCDYILLGNEFKEGCITPPLPPCDYIKLGNEFKQGCIAPLPPCDYILLGTEFKQGCIAPLPPCDYILLGTEFEEGCITPPLPPRNCIKVGNDSKYGCTYFYWVVKVSETFKASVQDVAKDYQGKSELKSKVSAIVQSYKKELEKKYQEIKASIGALEK